MTPEELVKLTQEMKALEVEVFEVGSVKVRFKVQYENPFPAVSPSTLDSELQNGDALQRQVNDRLMFGSSM